MSNEQEGYKAKSILFHPTRLLSGNYEVIIMFTKYLLDEDDHSSKCGIFTYKFSSSVDTLNTF